MGLVLYDWAVPYILGVEDPKAGVGLGLLSAGASFYIPFSTTSRRMVTYGEAEMVRTSALRGLPYGALVYDLIRSDDEEGGRALASLLMASSLAGGIGGSHWARKTQMTAGTARMVANGSDFGMLAAGGLLVFCDAEDDHVIAGSLLAGGIGGVAVAYHRAKALPYSWGDAEALRTAGILGAFAGAVVLEWSDTEDERAYAAGVLGGCAAGLVVGDRLVERTELTGGQAILIELGTIAGGVTGLGLAYLLASDNADATIYLTSSMVGATAGYALTYRSMRRDSGPAHRSSLELQLDPIGLAGLLGASDWVRKDLPQAPLLSVNWRF